MAVKLGKTGTVSAVLGENTAMLVEKSQKNGITMELFTEGEVTAHISKGQRLGTMTVKAGDKVVVSTFVGNDIKLDGEEYKFVKQEDILAVVTD